MNLPLASVALVLGSLALFWASLWAPNGASDRSAADRATAAETPAARRRRIGCLAAAVTLALIAHVGLVRTDADEGWSLTTPLPHLHEFFHYYIGTKYFDVLGYTGLYDAVVLADFEDVPERFRPDARVRDLHSNGPISRGEALDRGRTIRARFDPARWEAFKRDVALIRDANPSQVWDERGYVQDHGYNGTPLVTAVLGSFARQPFVSSRTFIDAVRWLDLYLLLLAGVAVSAFGGAALGLTFLLFTFANPLNDFAFVGAAYLRYGYLLALVGTLLALRERRPTAAGVLLAVACGLRVFPLVFYASLTLHALLRPDRVRRLRAQRRLHVAFAATSLAILASTSLIDTPSVRSAWPSFARNLSVHAGTPSANQVGLRTPFAYAPARDRHFEADGVDWVEETRQQLQARSGHRTAATLLLVGIVLVALRRTAEIEFAAPALLLLFAIFPLSHYYWAMLSLIPLAVPDRRQACRLLAGTFALFALLAAPGPLDTRIDLRFTLVSLVLLAFLLAVNWVVARRPLNAVAVGALAVLACTQAPPPTIEGDTYHSRTLGFAVDKPSAWHFGPVTSLRRETGERVRDLGELWELLQLGVITPLVSASPVADAREGRDPVFRTYVIPIRPGDSPTAKAMVKSLPLTRALTGFANGRAGDKPGFAVEAEAREVKLANRDGAVIELRYGIPNEDGDPLPVRERLGLVRREGEYWYFSLLMPEPGAPEIEAQLAEMLASVRLDD